MFCVFGFYIICSPFLFYEDFHFHMHFHQASFKYSFQFVFSEKKNEIKSNIKLTYIFKKPELGSNRLWRILKEKMKTHKCIPTPEC